MGGRDAGIFYVFNPKSRKYILRLQRSGSFRVTVPRGGNIPTAKQFARKHLQWMEDSLAKHELRTKNSEWKIGTEIFFKGQLFKIEAGPSGAFVKLGEELIAVCVTDIDHRRSIRNHLAKIAVSEFRKKVVHFAQVHQIPVKRLKIGNQRTRWGSYSSKGTLALNWRLIQTPESVADYLILHELMHHRQMNHSHKFWREVEKVCPDYQKAEQWLKEHGSDLMAC